IDNAGGSAKAAEILPPGGWLVLFGNDSPGDGSPVRRAIEAAHAEHGVPPNPARAPEDPVPAGTPFATPLTRDYPWTQTYTTAEWIDFLGTMSEHRILQPEHRDRLF